MISFIFFMAGICLNLWASWNMQNKFNKYNKVTYSKKVPAKVVANWILKQSNIKNVRIERISGSLTDHYDPLSKVLRLSNTVYNSNSVASIGVAAHECGHAIQDRTAYKPLIMRRKLVPLCNLGNQISIPLIFIGFIFEITRLIDIGIILFLGVIIFELITLPVEFDASRRACNILTNSKRFTPTEISNIKKVLEAAALTYVASTLSSIFQLLRFINMKKNN